MYLDSVLCKMMALMVVVMVTMSADEMDDDNVDKDNDISNRG